MRALILASVFGLALVASAQAAPLAPKPLGAVTYLTEQEWVPLSNDMSNPSPVGSAPPLTLASGGCGWGWHRHHWQDRWGNWHWGRCVPDEGRPYGGWGVGWYYPPSYWRRAPPP
jgi:hypothetical protein